MGNPEPTPLKKKQKIRVQKARIKKKERCRDSKEVVLTNEVDLFL